MVLVKINNAPITSPFHSIDSVHKTPHCGVDIGLSDHTEILSPDSGIISHIVHQGNEGLGNGIIMRLKDGNELVLGHLSEVSVKEGDLIHTGQSLGFSGNTGHSTGFHLHVGLREPNGHYIDPSHYSDMLAQLDNVKAHTAGLNFFPNPFKPVQNGFNEVKEFFQPFRDFIVWCHNIVSDVKSFGFKHWLGDQIFYVIKGILEGILYFDELVFLFPAIGALVLYFFIGANKYTKWIIPLSVGYFCCEMVKATLK